MIRRSLAVLNCAVVACKCVAGQSVTAVCIPSAHVSVQSLLCVTGLGNMLFVDPLSGLSDERSRVICSDYLSCRSCEHNFPKHSQCLLQEKFAEHDVKGGSVRGLQFCLSLGGLTYVLYAGELIRPPMAEALAVVLEETFQVGIFRELNIWLHPLYMDHVRPIMNSHYRLLKKSQSVNIDKYVLMIPH